MVMSGVKSGNGFQSSLITQFIELFDLLLIQIQDFQVHTNGLLLCGVYQSVNRFKNQYQILILVIASIFTWNFMVTMNI